MAAANAQCHPKLQEMVDAFAPGGCYGIEWELKGDSLVHKSHCNPGWRIEGVKKQGLKGLYTTESTKYSFQVGQGFVGKVFEAQKPFFVKDLQSPDPEEVKDAMQTWYGANFLRLALAQEYGIHSAIFLPLQSGVLEVGSSVVMKEVPKYFAPYHSKEMPPLATKDSQFPNIEQGSEAEPPALLKKLVDEYTVGGCYSIEWVLRDDALVHASHYNPAWRIEGVTKQGLNGLYTTESTTYAFQAGQGIVGKVFQNQEKLFMKDLQVPDLEAMKDAIQSWEGSAFMRSALAEKYGIHSALFLPSSKGVIEVGSSAKASDVEAFLSEGGKDFLAKGAFEVHA